MRRLSLTQNRDTENYTVKNTHVCWSVYVKLMVMLETVHVIPSGSCEVDMTLLLDRQMKNVWTGVPLPMEHRPTTTDLSAMSTEALSQYQTVFFWHTENYRNRSATQVLSILTFAYIFESFVMVMKPMFPVALSVIWMPN